jgi:hypothetical protein
MADIANLLANSAQTNADFDFGKINRSYWQGRDEGYKNEGRDLFKEGVPKNADGTINYGAMRDVLFKHGDVGQGTALDSLDLQRQQLKLGQEVSAKFGALENGGAPPSQPSIVSPPSANRQAPVAVAPPLDRGGAPQVAPQGGAPAPKGGATIMQVLAAQGIPNAQLGAASASIARQLGVEDPNAPIDVNDPQIRNVLVPAVDQLKRANIGQVVSADPPQGGPMPPVQSAAQAAPQPVTQAPPQAAPAFADRFAAANTRGLAPTEIDPNIQQRAAQYTAIMSNPAYPQTVRDAAKMRLETLQKNSELTGLQKEYAQAQRQGFGGTLQEFQDRSDDNKAQQAILTGSVLPKLDKSQETANAARDEINAIHRAREQLDTTGGIFSGSAADAQLKIAKVADFLGVPNADKITNTEAFRAAIGARVLSLVKGLGSGAGISNADRDYAAGMAGGDIKLNESSIRRIIDIGERAARAKIDAHNSSVSKMVKSNAALKDYADVYKVEAPGAYKKAAQGAGGKFASPADVHAAIASGSLKKGDTFMDQNGIQRVVP